MKNVVNHTNADAIFSTPSPYLTTGNTESGCLPSINIGYGPYSSVGAAELDIIQLFGDERSVPDGIMCMVYYHPDSAPNVDALKAYVWYNNGYQTLAGGGGLGDGTDNTLTLYLVTCSNSNIEIPTDTHGRCNQEALRKASLTTISLTTNNTSITLGETATVVSYGGLESIYEIESILSEDHKSLTYWYLFKKVDSDGCNCPTQGALIVSFNYGNSPFSVIQTVTTLKGKASYIITPNRPSFLVGISGISEVVFDIDKFDWEANVVEDVEVTTDLVKAYYLDLNGILHPIDFIISGNFIKINENCIIEGSPINNYYTKFKTGEHILVIVGDGYSKDVSYLTILKLDAINGYFVNTYNFLLSHDNLILSDKITTDALKTRTFTKCLFQDVGLEIPARIKSVEIKGASEYKLYLLDPNDKDNYLICDNDDADGKFVTATDSQYTLFLFERLVGDGILTLELEATDREGRIRTGTRVQSFSFTAVGKDASGYYLNVYPLIIGKKNGHPVSGVNIEVRRYLGDYDTSILDWSNINIYINKRSSGTSDGLTGTFDDITNLDFSLVLDRTYTLEVNGVEWGSESVSFYAMPESIKGDPGKNGDFYYSLYQRSDTKPNAPSNLSTTPQGAWLETEPTTGGKYLWQATIKCTYNNLGNLSYGSWLVIRLTGEDGTPGKDGTDYEYVYFRHNHDDPGVFTITLPSNKYGDDYFPKVQCTVDSSTILTTDNPSGITPDYPYEFVCTRESTTDANDVKIWKDFQGPFLWSAWGSKGTDGDGVEYIFYLTNNIAEYGTLNALWEFDSPENGWTDEPKQVSKTNRYCLVSWRKSEDGIYKGKQWSIPIIWNQYTESATVVDLEGDTVIIDNDSTDAAIKIASEIKVKLVLGSSTMEGLRYKVELLGDISTYLTSAVYSETPVSCNTPHYLKRTSAYNGTKEMLGCVGRVKFTLVNSAGTELAIGYLSVKIADFSNGVNYKLSVTPSNVLLTSDGLLINSGTTQTIAVSVSKFNGETPEQVSPLDILINNSTNTGLKIKLEAKYDAILLTNGAKSVSNNTIRYLATASLLTRTLVFNLYIFNSNSWVLVDSETVGISKIGNTGDPSCSIELTNDAAVLDDDSNLNTITKLTENTATFLVGGKPLEGSSVTASLFGDITNLNVCTLRTLSGNSSIKTYLQLTGSNLKIGKETSGYVKYTCTYKGVTYEKIQTIKVVNISDGTSYKLLVIPNVLQVGSNISPKCSLLGINSDKVEDLLSNSDYRIKWGYLNSSGVYTELGYISDNGYISNIDYTGHVGILVNAYKINSLEGVKGTAELGDGRIYEIPSIGYLDLGSSGYLFSSGPTDKFYKVFLAKLKGTQLYAVVGLNDYTLNNHLQINNIKNVTLDWNNKTFDVDLDPSCCYVQLEENKHWVAIQSKSREYTGGNGSLLCADNITTISNDIDFPIDSETIGFAEKGENGESSTSGISLLQTNPYVILDDNTKASLLSNKTKNIVTVLLNGLPLTALHRINSELLFIANDGRDEYELELNGNTSYITLPESFQEIITGTGYVEYTVLYDNILYLCRLNLVFFDFSQGDNYELSITPEVINRDEVSDDTVFTIHVIKNEEEITYSGNTNNIEGNLLVLVGGRLLGESTFTYSDIKALGSPVVFTLKACTKNNLGILRWNNVDYATLTYVGNGKGLSGCTYRFRGDWELQTDSPYLDGSTPTKYNSNSATIFYLDIVKHGSHYYLCSKTGTNTIPGDSGADWIQFDEYEYLITHTLIVENDAGIPTGGFYGGSEASNNDIMIWSGAKSGDTAPFRVYKDGTVVAKQIEAEGTFKLGRTVITSSNYQKYLYKEDNDLNYRLRLPECSLYIIFDLSLFKDNIININTSQGYHIALPFCYTAHGNNYDKVSYGYYPKNLAGYKYPTYELETLFNNTYTFVLDAVDEDWLSEKGYDAPSNFSLKLYTGPTHFYPCKKVDNLYVTGTVENQNAQLYFSNWLNINGTLECMLDTVLPNGGTSGSVKNLLINNGSSFCGKFGLVNEPCYNRDGTTSVYTNLVWEDLSQSTYHLYYNFFYNDNYGFDHV